MLVLRLKNNKVRQKVIRLRRRSNNNYLIYDIVVTLKDNRNRGSYFEKIGFYNPNIDNKCLIINSKSLSFWLMKGAFVNHTVKKYIFKFLLF